jgi:hypothetical protein
MIIKPIDISKFIKFHRTRNSIPYLSDFNFAFTMIVTMKVYIMRSLLFTFQSFFIINGKVHFITVTTQAYTVFNNTPNFHL